MTLDALAALIGVDRSMLTATAGTRTANPALGTLVRILTTATEMAGNSERAAIWFKHQPLPGWNGKTGYDLVSEGRADDVVAYLEAVRSGVYA